MDVSTKRKENQSSSKEVEDFYSIGISRTGRWLSGPRPSRGF